MEENKNNISPEETDRNNTDAEVTSVEKIVDEKQGKMNWPSGKKEDEPEAYSNVSVKDQANDDTQISDKANNDDGDPVSKASRWQTWLTLAGIAIIMIIIALPDSRQDVEITAEIDTKINEEEMISDDYSEMSKTGMNKSITSTISSPAGTSTSVMQPVSRGDFTYHFEGIAWEFAPDGDRTKVMFKFDEFSRRAGNYVTFGRPFKMGSYAGTCRVVEQLEIDQEVEPDTGLGFVQCLKIDGSGTEIGLFQDSNDPTLVIAKTRTINGQGKTSNFREFFSRDITTIVR